LSQQYSVSPQTSYYIGAKKSDKTPYSVASNLMPQPNTNGAPSAQSATGAPFATIAEASVEHDIEPQYLSLLTTGATGLSTGVLDTRVPGAGSLNGSFPLLGPNISDDDYTGDTTHRFYQAWQQQDCSLAAATKDNPSGSLNDLFPFVMATIVLDAVE
jgi:phospholipase C